MFYLRNKNMDDLFREAAEGYHLDAEKASDWESVHAALGNRQHTEKSQVAFLVAVFDPFISMHVRCFFIQKRTFSKSWSKCKK